MRNASPALLGLIVAVSIAVAAEVFLNIGNFNAVLLGVSVEIVALLIQVLVSISESEKRVLNLLSLDEKILSKPVSMQTSLLKIVSDYDRAIAIGDPLFTKQAEEAIDNCSLALDHLSQGTLPLVADDIFSFNKELVKQSSVSVRATNLAHAGFWMSGGGEDYLRENINAVRRGVKVTRVFIIPLQEVRLWEAIMRRQLDEDIDVRVVDLDSIPVELKRDFALYDDKYVLSLSLTPDRQTVVESFITNKKAEIRMFEKIFERLVRNAKDVSTVLSSEGGAGLRPLGADDLSA